MVVTRLRGGLGNYLFQIAVGYSLAEDNNDVFAIDLNRIQIDHSHWSIYMDNILRKIKTINLFENKNHYLYESHTYRPIPYSEDILLDGFFQTDKYLTNKNKVLDLFRIDNTTLCYLKEKYSNILNDENTCSIHVRRGNFLVVDFYKKLDINYYNKAIQTIGTDKHFVVFSNDIAWCKDVFKNINVTFIENEKDYIDLYLMSFCKNNITANSTFSWWGAYLNENENKKVITPAVWFNHTHSNADVTPKDWIKI